MFVVLFRRRFGDLVIRMIVYGKNFLDIIVGEKVLVFIFLLLIYFLIYDIINVLILVLVLMKERLFLIFNCDVIYLC